MTSKNTNDASLQEQISVCIVDPSDMEWLKQQNIGEIAGVISFGDQAHFQQVISDRIPAIFSHSGYWTEDGRYVDSSEQGPLQIFSIKNAKSVVRGEYNGIIYSESDEYLLGSIDVKEPEGADGSVLADITEQAYNAIYALMQKTGKHTLIRVGNYVTDILAETTMQVGGKMVPTVRYRAFCAGRSVSLEKLFKYTETTQIPTATGIGNHYSDRYVKIFFIAGKRDDVQNHKNPYQTDPANYSAQLHGIAELPGQVSLPKFSRATSLSKYNMLFIGGTASILGQDVVHEGNVVKQTIQALQNIKYTMEEAENNTGLSFTKLPIVLKVFVKNKTDYDAIKMVVDSKEHNPLQNVIVESVYAYGDVCRDQWLVEISCETMDYETAGLILEHKLDKQKSYERNLLHKLFQLGINETT